jgi:hypothetical protein
MPTGWSQARRPGPAPADEAASCGEAVELAEDVRGPEAGDAFRGFLGLRRGL